MLAGESAKPRGKPDIAKYEPERQGGAGAALLTAPAAYNPAADVTATAGKEEKKKVGDQQSLYPLGHGFLEDSTLLACENSGTMFLVFHMH